MNSVALKSKWSQPHTAWSSLFIYRKWGWLPCGSAGSLTDMMLSPGPSLTFWDRLSLGHVPPSLVFPALSSHSVFLQARTGSTCRDLGFLGHCLSFLITCPYNLGGLFPACLPSPSEILADSKPFIVWVVLKNNAVFLSKSIHKRIWGNFMAIISFKKCFSFLN